MKIIDGKEQEYIDYKNKCIASGNERYLIYAEKWANALEEKIQNSNDSVYTVIKENASLLSYESGETIYNKFTRGIGVTILYSFWIYGDELTQWCNDCYDKNKNK